MAHTTLVLQYDDKTDTYRSEYYNFTASTQVLHEVMGASGLTLSDAFRELVRRSGRHLSTDLSHLGPMKNGDSFTITETVTMGGSKSTLQILDELLGKKPLTQEEQDALSKYTAAARQRRAEERQRTHTTGPPPVTMGYTGVPPDTWNPAVKDNVLVLTPQEACWAEVVKTWQTCQDAHYEPEEIGDILYTLVEELLQGKVPE